MDRDCNKCIHHTSGSCSAWECTGTKTVDDVRADELAEVEEAMYHQCFECDNDEDMQKWEGGNWIRYKLFENVMEQLKEQGNERL